MQALELLRVKSKSSAYEFKHALVRDALYQSLLNDARKTLHGRIAEEIERRNGNRLNEVTELLAHHYHQTDYTDKAFIYLSMAGSKSLSVYSLDEASTYFATALALLDKDPNCSSDDQVGEFLASYILLLNMANKGGMMIDVLERNFARIDRIGDDLKAVLIRHQYILALIWNTRYREAAAMQQDTLMMANRLGDSRSRAYAARQSR